MSTISMTINGKPFTSSTFKSEFDKAIFKTVTEGAKKQVLDLLTPAEASQVTINFVGDRVDGLKLEVLGPDEIIQKIKDA